MKKTLSGTDAFNVILSTPVPEKTDSYTPIKHTGVAKRIRSEIVDAGFIIKGEEYKATNDGQVAVGLFRIQYKPDPDIELTASFMNSYNKQYAFRFALGAGMIESGNTMMFEHADFGAWKRVHKGAADVLAEGKIKELIASAGGYWDELVLHKDRLKKISMNKFVQCGMMGTLFMEDVLTTYQLNIVKKHLNKLKYREYTAWEIYDAVAASLRETHPAEFMDMHVRMHDIFARELMLDHAEPAPAPEEDTKEAEYLDPETELGDAGPWDFDESDESLGIAESIRTSGLYIMEGQQYKSYQTGVIWTCELADHTDRRYRFSSPSYIRDEDDIIISSEDEETLTEAFDELDQPMADNTDNHSESCSSYDGSQEEDETIECNNCCDVCEPEDMTLIGHAYFCTTCAPAIQKAREELELQALEEEAAAQQD